MAFKWQVAKLLCCIFKKRPKKKKARETVESDSTLVTNWVDKSRPYNRLYPTLPQSAGSTIRHQTVDSNDTWTRANWLQSTRSTINMQTDDLPKSSRPVNSSLLLTGVTICRPKRQSENINTRVISLLEERLVTLKASGSMQVTNEPATKEPNVSNDKNLIMTLSKQLADTQETLVNTERVNLILREKIKKLDAEEDIKEAFSSFGFGSIRYNISQFLHDNYARLHDNYTKEATMARQEIIQLALEHMANSPDPPTRAFKAEISRSIVHNNTRKALITWWMAEHGAKYRNRNKPFYCDEKHCPMCPILRSDDWAQRTCVKLFYMIDVKKMATHQPIKKKASTKSKVTNKRPNRPEYMPLSWTLDR